MWRMYSALNRVCAQLYLKTGEKIMETLKEILTGLHLGGIFALLQMDLYTLILVAVAVGFWWGSIVINDLIKRLKTGARK